MTTWIFEQLAGASVRRDPNETQLFKTAQAEEGEYAGTDALVREILQNSMDAATGNGPVRIRLALHSRDELPERNRLGQYFSRLKAPLQHRGVALEADGVPRLQEGFLVCEDFGTRGLGGNPLLAKDPVPGSTERQDFFWFWRNIGRSGKTGEDLGRWGLGKTVYRAASQVGCMFGLTIREEDGRQLLLGQAVLKIHEHDGNEFVPEGYWCAGKNQAGLPLPIEDPVELSRFRDEWKLARGHEEPGLSVVVPYVAPELKGQRLLQAICVHFFLPIIRGELIVDLVTPDPSVPDVCLDRDSITEWCGAISWDGPKRTKRHVAPPIEFVKRCLAVQEKSIPTHLLGQKRLPEMNEAAFDAKKLTNLRNQFAEEKLVAVKVRINLPKRLSADVEGELIVFVQRQADGKRADTYYTREGMTITKLNSKAGFRGVLAFVSVDKLRLGTDELNPLTSLLGDSEGPAHEDWDTSEERPDRFWLKWKGRIKFCRRIVDNIVEVLSPPTNEADFEMLSDYFSIEKVEAPQRSRRPDENGDGPVNFGGIAATPQWYRLEGRRGGFRIASANREMVPEQARLKVSVAYDLPSGNPIKKWSPFDFDFNADDSISFSGKGVKPKRLAGNILSLHIERRDFSFSAVGFDEHRDLLVRIDEDNRILSDGKADES